MEQNTIITINLNPCLDINFSVNNFRPDDVMRVGEKTITPGGKGFNAARFLLELGTDVTSLGIIGGHNGLLLKKLLSKLNLSCKFLIEEKAETRTNYNFFLQMVWY